MHTIATASNISAPTQYLEVGDQRYAYRRFGNGKGLPLLCLQHFTGTLDNWDPAVTDPLASGREVLLFDNAGVGRSRGTVPRTVAAMAHHALAFLDGLQLDCCDVLGYSLGGMVAQAMVLEQPSVFRRLVLVGTAPRGGDDIMHLEKPSLARYLRDPTLHGYSVLQKIFFAPTACQSGVLPRTREPRRVVEPTFRSSEGANEVASVEVSSTSCSERVPSPAIRGAASMEAL